MSSPPKALTPAQQETINKVSQEAEGKPYLQRMAMLSLALLQETEREARAENSPAPASDAADSDGGTTATSPTLVGTPSLSQLYEEAHFSAMPARSRRGPVIFTRSPSTDSEPNVPLRELIAASCASNKALQHPPSRGLGNVEHESTSDSDTDRRPQKRMRVSSPARQADDDIVMPDRTTEPHAPSDVNPNRRAIATVVHHDNKMANKHATLAEGYEPEHV